jgi:MFS family permease
LQTDLVVPASWGDLLRNGNFLKSIAVTGGVALHATNVYLVTTILPSVVSDIGGLGYYAWNTTLFIVASIIGSALTSKLLSRYSPRRAYLLALGIFAVGSMVCASAFNMPWLLLGRTVQGLGAVS